MKTLILTLTTVSFCIVAIAVGRSCGREAGERAASRISEKRTVEVEKELSLNPESYNDFVDVELGGLKMKVPKELSKPTREEVSGTDLELFEKYTKIWTTRSFIVKHFVFNEGKEIGHERASKMLESDLKNQPRYTGSLRGTQVGEHPAVILDTQWGSSGARARQSILFFSRGRELWEIHVFGVNDRYPAQLKEMKQKIFQSINLGS